MEKYVKRSRPPIELLIVVLMAISVSGCPKNNDRFKFRFWKKTGKPAREFLDTVKGRAAGVSRLDASMVAHLQGDKAQYKGKFYGSFQIERRNEMAMFRLQAYTVLGAPVLEIIADRKRIQVFSPLDNKMYVNFTEFIEGSPAQAIPMSAFNRMAFPIDILQNQVELLLGLGFDQQLYYKLAEQGDTMVLQEKNGPFMLREITYSKNGPDILSVKAYKSGALAGAMTFSNHIGEGPVGFLPRNMTINQGDTQIDLALSRIRINDQVKSPAISFRPPAGEQVILLTPTVK